jgi:hypothetical protein
VLPASETDPGLQLIHLEAASEYVPAAHSVHAVDPASEYFPATQFAHSLEPVARAYVPAVQFVQALFDEVFLNFPAAHASHTAPSYPALHTHAVRGHDLEVALMPQSVHAEESLSCEYFPTSHSTHGPPFGPEKPALQVHIELPASAFELAGQSTQPPVSERDEYFPAAQFSQALLARKGQLFVSL